MAQRTSLLEASVVTKNNGSSSGDIRAQGSFQTVSYVNGTYSHFGNMKMCALVPGVTVNPTFGDSDNIQTWVQPANTLITQIDVWCVTAPVIATGNIGYEVGTVSGQGEIVAEIADELLDGGTTGLAINSVAQTSLVEVTQSQTSFVVSAQYTGADRNIFCNITNSANASTTGSFTFVIQYIDLNSTVAA